MVQLRRPTSWLVIGHVDHARSHMNFSTWPELTADDGRAEAEHYLEEICEMVQERTMPLSSYLFIHCSAHLSDTEIGALCGWTADEQLRVRKELSAARNAAPGTTRSAATCAFQGHRLLS